MHVPTWACGLPLLCMLPLSADPCLIVSSGYSKQTGHLAVGCTWVAGQFVMSGFLDFKMAPWKRSCVTRTVAIVPTLVIAVVFQASHKLDQLNQLLNILQSIMLPFAIIPVSCVV